ncbi:MAG: type IIL restriction-modification enzyme MmeI [Myxococcaceae bacterium]
MNAVEIEEAAAALAGKPFDATEFAWEFLAAFDNPETTIKRLRKGETNKSDIGGVLQTNNIHIKVCLPGQVSTTLDQLRESPATRKAKAKFILATDGEELQAEHLLSGEHLVTKHADFAERFGFFLPLAGITTVKEIAESSFDIKATGRLNRLYLELRKTNPAWNKRAPDMNHFMARLIFCFFAEDTDIFGKAGLFTSTVEQMSSADNTHEIIEEIFRALNTREASQRTRWARDFPYVNGGLFSGSVEVPKFSKTARSYLLNIGKLNWKLINPDIFGSMIQAVADDEERGALGMHYP